MAQRPNLNKPKAPAGAPVQPPTNTPPRAPPQVPSKVPSQLPQRAQPPAPPVSRNVNLGGISLGAKPIQAPKQNKQGRGFLRRVLPWALGLGLAAGGVVGYKKVGGIDGIKEKVNSVFPQSGDADIQKYNNYAQKIQSFKEKIANLKYDQLAGLQDEYTELEKTHSELFGRVENGQLVSEGILKKRLEAAKKAGNRPNYTYDDVFDSQKISDIKIKMSDTLRHFVVARSTFAKVNLDKTLKRNLDSLPSNANGQSLVASALKAPKPIAELAYLLRTRKLAIPSTTTVTKDVDGVSTESLVNSFAPSKEEFTAFNALYDHLNKNADAPRQDVMLAADAYGVLEKSASTFKLPGDSRKALKDSLELIKERIKVKYGEAIRAPPRIVQLQNGSVLIQLAQPKLPLKQFEIHEYPHSKEEEKVGKGHATIFSPVVLHGLMRYFTNSEGKARSGIVANYNIPFKGGFVVIKPEHVPGPSVLQLSAYSSFGLPFSVPGGILGSKGFDPNALAHYFAPMGSEEAEMKNIEWSIRDNKVVIDREMQPDGSFKVVLKSGQNLIQPATPQDEINAQKVLSSQRATAVISDIPAVEDERFANPEEVPDEPSQNNPAPVEDSSPQNNGEPSAPAPGTMAPVEDDSQGRLDFKGSHEWRKYAMDRNLRPRTAGVSPFTEFGEQLRRKRRIS